MSCAVSPVPLLRFRFLPRLFRASLFRFAFLPHLFRVSLYRFAFFAAFIQLRFCGLLFCCFFLFPFPLFCFSDSVYLAFFVSSAVFLLPRFSCSVFQSAKSLKNVLKIFMVWRSLYRGHILTIFILILSNLIQKIKTQFVFFLDFCCFWFYF